MEKLTKEKAVELHRELWKNIVEYIKNINTLDVHPRDLKESTLLNLGYNPDEIISSCWLCTFVYQQKLSETENNCAKYCPLYNPNHNDTLCLNGLYHLFYYKTSELFGEPKSEYSQSYQELIQIAKQIRDLPVIERSKI